MTTNSFGGGLPPFDFNQQVKPAVSRLSRSMPLLARLVPVVTVAAFGQFWPYPTPGSHAKLLMSLP
ncbi:uncharacterized protein BCR38DRAFT_445913 [Pseudomassariella vexata]|uniref:Uncharacterized protein n=1 Tax=Pseudomassariella vexata TaxID=1141098 RepID=A0A1Y2DJ05_9PEZI|nr:uncharacterized protein BCR38DRAFT_445913 [Pseudomassariella vexata]ORY59211.1 hypothetical protein BCR38DRAFT_445913 [Pseudomassariella vexata]